MRYPLHLSINYHHQAYSEQDLSPLSPSLLSTLWWRHGLRQNKWTAQGLQRFFFMMMYIFKSITLYNTVIDDIHFGFNEN